MRSNHQPWTAAIPRARKGDRGRPAGEGSRTVGCLVEPTSCGEEELRWEKPHLARQQPRSSGDSGARRHTGLQTLKKPVTHPLAQGSGGATDKTAAVVAVS